MRVSLELIYLPQPPTTEIINIARQPFQFGKLYGFLIRFANVLLTGWLSAWRLSICTASTAFYFFYFWFRYRKGSLEHSAWTLARVDSQTTTTTNVATTAQQTVWDGWQCCRHKLRVNVWEGRRTRPWVREWRGPSFAGSSSSMFRFSNPDQSPLNRYANHMCGRRIPILCQAIIYCHPPGNEGRFVGEEEEQDNDYADDHFSCGVIVGSIFTPIDRPTEITKRFAIWLLSVSDSFATILLKQDIVILKFTKPLRINKSSAGRGRMFLINGFAFTLNSNSMLKCVTRNCCGWMAGNYYGPFESHRICGSLIDIHVQVRINGHYVGNSHRIITKKSWRLLMLNLKSHFSNPKVLHQFLEYLLLSVE